MAGNYNYPLDLEWTTDELVIVMEMWKAVEDLYETGMIGKEFLRIHQRFKTVVKSIGEERQLSKTFEEASSYSLYRCVQLAKQDPTSFIRMKGAL